MVAGAAAIGLLPVAIAAGAVVGLIAATLILRNPVWGAYALVLSVPVQKAFSPSENFTVTQATFVLVLGVWFAWQALRDDRRLVFTPFGIAILVFVVSTLPSLWVTTSYADSLAEISRWLVTILSYLIMVNSVHTRRQMNYLIAAMFVAGVFEAVLGLIQAYGAIGPVSFLVGNDFARAYGTIGAPNSFAGYLNMTLPMAISLAVYHWSRFFSARARAHLFDRPAFISVRRLWKPAAMTLFAVLIFWTLITTLSRGAWIGLAAGLLAMVFCLGKRAAPALGALFATALLLVVLAVAGALPSVVSDRFEQLTSQLAIFDPRGLVPTPDNYAIIERMVHWQVAGNMFLSSPIIGVGFGNYNTLFNKFGVQGWPYSRGHAHNYYLNVVAETGIVGLTFYMIMLITALAMGFRALRRVRARRDIYGEAVVIGSIGILVTFMVHNIFENLHALNMGIHWGAALALFTLVDRGWRSGEEAAPVTPGA